MRTLTATGAALVLALASGCTQPPATSVAAQPSSQAGMQGAPIEFRVVATSRNPSACQQFDAALSRVHTFLSRRSRGRGSVERRQGNGAEHIDGPARVRICSVRCYQR